MKEFNVLKDLLLSLDIVETKELINRIGLNNDNLSNEVKSIKLINLVRTNSELSSTEIQNPLYGSRNDSAFRKLLSRLTEKILDGFLHKDKIETNNKYDKRAVDIFLLERKLLLSDILRYRGNFRLSEDCLDSVIKDAKYYEHYDILIFALEKKLKKFDQYTEYSVVKFVENEIKLYRKFQLALKYTITNYTKIIIRQSFNNNKNIQLSYPPILSKIKSYVDVTKSKLIKFHYYYLLLFFYSIQGLYYPAFKTALELKEFLLSNNEIKSKQRIATVYLNLALFSRCMFDFDISIKFLNDAQNYLVENSLNRFIQFENFYLTHLFAGNVQKSNYYLNLISSEIKISDLELSCSVKVFYFRLVQYFINSQFAELIKLFTEWKAPKKDWKELNFEVRQLIIMSLINVSKFDLADNYIENLRKNYKYDEDSNISFRRHRLILKTLLSLSRDSYNFKKHSQKEYIKLFNTKELLWLPNSNELIPFEEWFDSKVKNVSYEHKAAMERVKKRAAAMA